MKDKSTTKCIKCAISNERQMVKENSFTLTALRLT